MNRLCLPFAELLALSSLGCGRTDIQSVSDPARPRRRRGRLAWLQALVVSGAAWAFVPAAAAATYQVTTTANNGAGSLDAAIRFANRNPGADRIEFAILGAAPLVITPTAALPAITDPVTIDGYTQAGSVPATAIGPAFMGIAIDAVNVDSGLEVLSDGCTIRGLAIMNPSFSQKNSSAIVLTGDGNLVEGNHLGTDAAGGALAYGNLGVTIAGTGNVLGGDAPEHRNVIAGIYGVDITSGGGNRVEGNWIGIDSRGNPFGHQVGVQIDLSDGNEVVDNVISDYFVGLEVWGDRTVIQGNRIGTDPDGLVAIPNGLGVNISGGDENQIGGTGDGEGNLISGNPIGGIQLEGGLDGASVGNVLEGNTIGLDATGTVPMPNGGAIPIQPGVSLVGAQDTTIGGTVPGSANVVSGNDGDGIRISYDGSGNRVLGNRIGTDRLGIRVLGNAGHGVSISGSDNWVGDGSGLLARNVIAHNGGDGVWVEDGTGNPILENVIFRNGGLGIDLGPDGHSGVDPAPDADVGANDAQTPPFLTVAVANPLQTSVEWTLESTPSQQMRIDFFGSVACDPTGFGEGFVHLGTQVVTTNAAGRVSRTFTAGNLPVGSVVTATATPLVGGAPTSTSEFSYCIRVTEAPP
jgi:hypothetical protein